MTVRHHLLFRSVEGDRDHWYAVSDKEMGVNPFDRGRLEEILQDLLS